MASDVQTVERINTAKRNLSKSADLKEEMTLIMGPYINWEQLLVPAPMAITLLGELMLVSTQTDFSLERKPPKEGFKYIRYPSSFRACLAQVANEGYMAFDAAHNGMDKIRLRTAKVPDNVKNAVQILLTGDKSDIQDMLPIELTAIKQTADVCLSNAKDVESKFADVISLTGELNEALVNVRGQYEEDFKEAQIMSQVAKEHQKALEEEKKYAKESYDMMKKSLNDAEKDYKNAMKSIPSGWEVIGMNFVEDLTNVATPMLVSGVQQLLRGGMMNIQARLLNKSQPGTGQQGTAPAPPPKPKLNKEASVVYSKVVMMQNYIEMLTSNYLEGDKLKANALKGSDVMTMVKANISSLQNDLTHAQATEAQSKALQIAVAAEGICAKLEQMKKDFNEDSKEAKDVAKSLCEVHTNVMTLSMAEKMKLSANATTSVAPNQAVWKPQSPTMVGGSAAQQAAANARFKAESAKNQLKDAQDMYTKSTDQLRDTTRRLADVMGEIAKLSAEKIDFEKIKKVLIKGIKALGELKEQWSKLVIFFHMMSNIIECCLNVSLKSFLDYVHTADEKALAGYTINSLRKDMIYQQAFDSAKIAYLVNMISGSYVAVSNQYLIEKIAGLSKLLAYDSATQGAQIQQEMTKLTNGCKDAQKGIVDIVQSRKDEFDQSIKRRMQKIETEMQECLPITENTKSVTKRIKEAAEKSKAIVKKDESTAGLNADNWA